MPRLPEIILWAFGLEEGDLLTVSEERTSGRYRFEGYSRAVSFIEEAIGFPWPYLERLLTLPQAALGRDGTLCLPEEATSLRESPGQTLCLSVDGRPSQSGFSVERTGRTIEPCLNLEVRYVLPVKKGYIRVPADLCSRTGFDKGLLAYTARMGCADFALFGENDSLDGRRLASLGLDGSLLLPEAFLKDLKAEWRVRLSARIHPAPSFRLAYEPDGN